MIELKDVIEEGDIQKLYVARYRAGALARELWRLAQGRRHWRTASVPAAASSGSSDFAIAGGAAPRPRYIEVQVASSACLRLPTHELRVWASDLRAGMRSLGPDEAAAWEDYLLWPRHSAVFHVVSRWSMVRRAPGVSVELADAALRLLSFVDVPEVLGV